MVASPEWVDALRRFLLTNVPPEDLEGINFSLSWEFSDPPADLRRDGCDVIGFSIVIRDGGIEIGDQPLAIADGLCRADHATVAQSIHLNNEDDMAWTMANLDRLLTERKITMIGFPNPVQEIFLKTNVRERFYNLFSE